MVALMVGALFGTGVVLVLGGSRARRPVALRLPGWLRPAGGATAAFAATFAAALLLSHVVVIAAALAVVVAVAPSAIARGRRDRRQRRLAHAWPDAVDHLASAVRAGLSLPEALAQLGDRGPEPLRLAFAGFGALPAGRFDDALDRLKDDLADPVGDRVIESLRMAHQVGGGDLGRVLRSLSAFLRDDLRTRGEIESRQSWTVNGARLAVAAPWSVLLLMSLQPGLLARFNSPTGLAVLVGGAAACVVSYRAMLRLGRLPMERRVLA